MRARRKAAAAKRWTRHELDEAKADAILRDLTSLASEGLPDRAHALFDRQGLARRIHAVYPDGWRITVSIATDGSYSISHAITFSTRRSS